MYYNDYENAVRNYLHRYNEFVVRKQILSDRMKDLQKQLMLKPAPKTTQYRFDAVGGGGWDKPSSEQVALEQKEMLLQKYNEFSTEYNELINLLQALGQGLQILSGIQYEIVKSRGINHEPWEKVKRETHHDESYCRREFRKALRILAGVIFGPDIHPYQTKINFFKSKTRK